MRRGRALRIAILAVVAGHGVWAQMPGGAPGASAPGVDRTALVGDLAALSADSMEGREAGTPGGERARAFLVEGFKTAGLTPLGGTYLHPVPLPLRGGTFSRTGANVVGLLAGTRRPARYVVLSAHYDHIGVRNGVVFNGANDNASGTAARLAIARHFAARPPAHSLLFVAFDAEEIGLVGARAFVASPPVEASAIALNLNVDMIGRETADRLFVVGTRLQPSLKPLVERVAARAPLKLVMGHDDPGNRRDDWTRDSDHYAFIEAGIPALLFSVEDTAQHHESTDDFETMTIDFYVRAVQTVIDVVTEFDKG